MSELKYIFKQKTKRTQRYTCSVPLPEPRKYKTKHFTCSKYTNPKSAALLWRDKVGREEWGTQKWDAILATKYVRRFRSPDMGVCVYPTLSGGTWDIWMVSWRLSPEERFSKCFSIKRYGTWEAAELAAHKYAQAKRSELVKEKPVCLESIVM